LNLYRCLQISQAMELASRPQWPCEGSA